MRSGLCFPLCLVAASLGAVPQADSVSADFDAWFRRFRRGREDWKAAVIEPVMRRGTAADGKRVLALLESRRAGTEQRSFVLRGLARGDCPLAIQATVVARLRAGAGPALAGDLIPLLGSWHASRWRPLLLGFVRGEEPRLAAIAALTLASSGVVEPENADVVLSRVLTELADPRESHALKRALVRVPREVRRVRSVPVLLAELARVDRALEGKDAAPTALSFYAAALHEALEDLTGFSAPASDVERWQAFWDAERNGFHLRPRPARASETVAGGFFGIPVRGRRVLFVLDTSGSMRRPVKAAEGTSRLALAKRELMKAVAGLDPEAEFNVVLFADERRFLTRRFETPSKTRLAALRRFLGSAVSEGGTGLHDALRSGLAGRIRVMRTRSRRSIDEVFVLSDGSPRTSPKRILESVGRWNRGRTARIHTIYLGDGDDTESVVGRIPHGRAYGPVEFMRKLAEQNGGVFRRPH